jgi:hypothetical protein
MGCDAAAHIRVGSWELGVALPPDRERIYGILSGIVFESEHNLSNFHSTGQMSGTYHLQTIARPSTIPQIPGLASPQDLLAWH